MVNTVVQKNNIVPVNSIYPNIATVILSFLPENAWLDLTQVSKSLSLSWGEALKIKKVEALKLPEELLKLLRGHFKLERVPITSDLVTEDSDKERSPISFFLGNLGGQPIWKTVKFLVQPKRSNHRSSRSSDFEIRILCLDKGRALYRYIFYPGPYHNPRVSKKTVQDLVEEIKNLLEGSHLYYRTIPSSHPSIRRNPPVPAAPAAVSPPPPVLPPASPSIREPLWELASVGGRLMKQAVPFVCAAAVAFVAYRYFAYTETN